MNRFSFHAVLPIKDEKLNKLEDDGHVHTTYVYLGARGNRHSGRLLWQSELQRGEIITESRGSCYRDADIRSGTAGTNSGSQRPQGNSGGDGDFASNADADPHVVPSRLRKPVSPPSCRYVQCRVDLGHVTVDQYYRSRQRPPKWR